MPWQQGKEHQLSPKSLGANILCERHNHALSGLDAVAGVAFSVLRDFQADLRTQAEPHGDEFALVHGNDLERWLLKLFWGAAVAGVIGKTGQPIKGIRSNVDPARLARVLFRRKELPPGWGLYMAGKPNVPFSGEAEVAVDPQTGPDGTLWAGTVELGAVAFRFALGVPDPQEGRELNHHPQGICISTPDRRVQKVLALGWDDGGSPPVLLTREGDGSTTTRPSQV
ncbi:MAG: hypothetical protein QOG53_3525 [Frankiales bacterium]|jgi:hypothetical protein|nr:hypothetical protein [Frankiales bacterium]